MTIFRYIHILVFGLYLSACAQEQPTPQVLSFTKKEVTNLVMVTQGFLDGHLPSTGHLKEGATLLIFEDEFMWAIGKTSLINTLGKQTRYSWHLNKRGQIVMWNIPDDPDFAPEPERCTLTKTKEYTRKFTKEGLAEKIDANFRCDSYPKGENSQHTFFFPLPLNPRTLYGQTTHWSSNPDTTKAKFLQNYTIKRQAPHDPKKYFYDLYKAGNYQNSLTITRTVIVHTDEGTNTETVGMARLLMFGHIVPRHGTLVHLSYSPIIYTPEGEDGYAHTVNDRYELHSILRAKNMIYNPFTGKNYADRPTDISRSVNANTPPLQSALVFK